MTITPNVDQIRELAQSDDDGPVVMLNLLKYKARAGDRTGEEEYRSFLDMVGQPAYQDAHRHREAGLERTLVVACSPRLDRIAELGR
jgi:hypothetical protein